MSLPNWLAFLRPWAARLSEARSSAALLVTAPLLLALAAACAAPGLAVSPQAGDFAFVEVDLRG
ncbi:MAG: hypothetical protein ACT4PU_11400 [Planctomycetota bacterium]